MNYKEYLDKYGRLTYRFRGVSMRPMLRQGIDSFTVVKKGAERCKKYDVALYQRGSQYVLHRVVKVLPDGYIILGDNCLNKEKDIREEQILGVMESFTRGNKEISVDNKLYKLYSRLWYYLYPIRFSLMWLRSKL